MWLLLAKLVDIAVCMNPGTCRAGRALIGMTQAELARAANVGLSTIKNYEAGAYVPIPNNLTAIRAALDAAGIMFLADGDMLAGGPGVRLKG